MYVEGVKDGRRFFKVLREISAQKPVVIWKGGRTEEGERAIASHTGALAVPQAIWDAAVRQCRAVKVTRMEELIDTLKALLYLPPVHGDRVGVAGGSGGDSVSTADVFAEAGLRVPLLTQESYDELATFFNVVGGSYRNPVDTASPVRRDMKRIIDTLERDNNIDNLVLIISTKPGWHITPEQLQGDIDLVDHVRKRTSKPVMAIVYFSNPDAEKEARGVILKLQEMGIPAFPSIERGALALKNAVDYYRLKGADV
jgi:acyl-CoA synthetase (NDP forming)